MTQKAPDLKTNPCRPWNGSADITWNSIQYCVRVPPWKPQGDPTLAFLHESQRQHGAEKTTRYCVPRYQICHLGGFSCGTTDTWTGRCSSKCSKSSFESKALLSTRHRRKDELDDPITRIYLVHRGYSPSVQGGGEHCMSRYCTLQAGVRIASDSKCHTGYRIDRFKGIDCQDTVRFPRRE